MLLTLPPSNVGHTNNPNKLRNDFFHFSYPLRERGEKRLVGGRRNRKGVGRSMREGRRVGGGRGWGVGGKREE